MKVLVLYHNLEKHLRKTVDDHLYCFQRYVPEAQFHYCNVYRDLPRYLKWCDYDGVILHYTFFATKWNQVFWKYFYRGVNPLKNISGHKVALPQDEYVHSEEVCKFFKEYGVQTVFTCAYPIDYQTLYPKEKSGLKHYFTTYPGFVDEESLRKINDFSQEITERNIDMGYRAFKLPYWLGRHGQLKYSIAAQFHQWKDKTPLRMDISTRLEDVFYGDDWWRFLLRCRTMLGSLGGASLHDPDGSIRHKVEKYVAQNPEAAFEEAEEECFKGQDYNLHLFALSPRHFEYAMARTCQVLVEGDYDGVLKPGVHYIEIKEDFSNIENVLKQVQDKKLCKKMAESAYKDVVESGKYTYGNFANQVISHIRKDAKKRSKIGSWIHSIRFAFVGLFLKMRKMFWRFHIIKFWRWFNKTCLPLQK